MKKLIVIIIATLAIGVIGSAVFFACKKENNVKESDMVKVSKNMLVKDDDIYILSKTTGINIDELSKKNYIIGTASALWRNIEIAKKKQPVSKADLNYMHNLVKQIEAANAIGSDKDIFALTMNFSRIIEKNGGFFYNNKQYGLQPYMYDGKNYLLPIEYMEVMQQQAIFLLNNINKDYPAFDRLPTNIQAKVLSLAFLKSIETRYNLPLKNELEECIQDAGLACTAALTLATSVYTASLAGCSNAKIPLAIGLCMLVQTGVYLYACYSAYDTYNTKVENCNLKYKK